MAWITVKLQGLKNIPFTSMAMLAGQTRKHMYSVNPTIPTHIPIVLRSIAYT